MTAVDLKNHPAVKAYYQHGFNPIAETESHIFGTCPFCGKEKKFYVNKENKCWDCKVCNHKGGFQSFLDQMDEYCQQTIDDDLLDKLSGNRGISAETLKNAKIGWNPTKESYTVPSYDVNGKLCDLRIYAKSKLFSTSGCRVNLWNSEAAARSSGVVWLCEGEWDGLAMVEILSMTAPTEVALAVPGAGTFKPQWIELFRGRDVRVLYDNDRAGQSGAIRVYNALSSVAESLKFLVWPESGLDEGYDIRDLYLACQDKQKSYEMISSMLADVPAGAEELTKDIAEKNAKMFTGTGTSAEEVYAVYKKWLHVPDTTVLDVLYGTIIANRLPGDPLWLFLVAPSGMTKTEYLQSVSAAKGITATSTLTPHALISGASGAGGVDPSLIPFIDGKVLIVKDFTTILNMNQQAREEIFGTLRDAYDGEITKVFGNGTTRHYVSKFGLVAGVTPAIEVILAEESALGERFLRFQSTAPTDVHGQLEYLRRAADNTTHETVMREELRAVGSQCLDYDFPQDVVIPEEIEEQLLYLAIWTATLRGTVMRDKFTKEIVARPYVEMGTRLSKQFMKLLYGIGMFKRMKRVTEAEYAIVKRLARCTAGERSGFILDLVWAGFRESRFTTSDLSAATRLPMSTIQRNLDGLYILRVVERETDASFRAAYRLTDDFVDLGKKSGVFM